MFIIVGTFAGLYAAWWLKRRLFQKTDSPNSKLNSQNPQSKAHTPTPSNLWWRALEKTRGKFFGKFSEDTQAFREELEAACLQADLGIHNTHQALEALDWPQLQSVTAAEKSFKARSQLSKIFQTWLPHGTQDSQSWPAKRSDGPCVIWFVGVNGVGKTTTIAKVAHELLQKGHTVLLGAGDTFRAAASEQLETWAQRLGIECVRGQPGADSSAVLFDAISAGTARKMDFVLCDSAGRLHNQGQLMEALAKNQRVMAKALPGSPHETILVLDGNTGQNMITQAEEFLKCVPVTGLILTKLDGTARGGAVLAIARKLQLPLRRLGLGESPEDFTPFDAQRFTEALLGLDANVQNP